MASTVDTAQITQAIHSSVEFAKILLGDEQASDFKLEEFEESADRHAWLVTISFLREENVQPLSFIAGIATKVRVYKVIEVTKETGEPVAMRNKPSSQ